MANIKQDLKYTLKLYSLTLIIPITLTIINILFVGILGYESNSGFLMNFKIIWVNYYFTGSVLNVYAFRWHLGILFCCFLFTKISN